MLRAVTRRDARPAGGERCVATWPPRQRGVDGILAPYVYVYQRFRWGPGWAQNIAVTMGLGLRIAVRWGLGMALGRVASAVGRCGRESRPRRQWADRAAGGAGGEGVSRATVLPPPLQFGVAQRLSFSRALFFFLQIQCLHPRIFYSPSNSPGRSLSRPIVTRTRAGSESLGCGPWGASLAGRCLCHDATTGLSTSLDRTEDKSIW